MSSAARSIFCFALVFINGGLGLLLAPHVILPGTNLGGVVTMPFLCPQCSGFQRSLTIAARIELPSDSRSDEITLQVLECSVCEFAGIGVYEESHRGALDDDSFSHVGYRASPDDAQRLKSRIGECPEPGNPRCGCPVHRELGSRNDLHRWNGLDRFQLEGQFRLQR